MNETMIEIEKFYDAFVEILTFTDSICFKRS